MSKKNTIIRWSTSLNYRKNQAFTSLDKVLRENEIKTRVFRSKSIYRKAKLEMVWLDKTGSNQNKPVNVLKSTLVFSTAAFTTRSTKSILDRGIGLFPAVRWTRCVYPLCLLELGLRLLRLSQARGGGSVCAPATTTHRNTSKPWLSSPLLFLAKSSSSRRGHHWLRLPRRSREL